MNEMQNNQFDRQFNQLDESLRTLAAADEQRGAAPRVETALLQAFRQQHAQEKAVLVAAPARASWFAQWRLSWGLGLAAAALMLIGFAWWNWRAAQVAPPPEPFIATQTPTPLPTVAPMNEPAPLKQIEAPRAQFVAQRKMRRVAPKAINAEQIAAVEEEIATEFFPLVSENALPERGQLRRVSVPRSTLINFGLPVNGERLEVPINADLLVGEDGAARAIRFIQDQFPAGNFRPNGYGRALPAAYRNPR